MARRILNRKDLRADYDAAERRQADGEEGPEDEGDEEEAAEAKDEDAAEEDGEEAPKKKKAVQTTKAKPRTRTPKVTRMKVVWGVFNNANQCVATYPYPQRKDAE